METQRWCNVCEKTFSAHHRARYCDTCRQGIVDGIIPASADLRWRLRHPQQFAAAVQMRREKKKETKGPRKKHVHHKKPTTAYEIYQHEYYKRVTKQKRIAKKE